MSPKKSNIHLACTLGSLWLVWVSVQEVRSTFTSLGDAFSFAEIVIHRTTVPHNSELETSLKTTQLNPIIFQMGFRVRK